MKPGRFTYHAPRELDEALALLGEYGDRSKVLAGGQSLLPMLNFRLTNVEHLIDINRIGARFGELTTGATITIPALVRQRQAERSPELAADLPMLGEALRQVAHPQIRNRGTVCGSLAHADPAAELPTVMSVLDVTCTLASIRGVRQVDIADFFRFHLTTALEPDELLLQVTIRRPPPGMITVFREFATRRGDFALAAVAAAVRFDGATVTDCRIAAAGVGATPQRLTTAETLAVGSELGAGTLGDAATAAGDAVEPSDDIHASAAYRRRLTGVLVRRALDDARARQEATHA